MRGARRKLRTAAALAALALGALGALSAGAGIARAQNTDLTVTGAPLSFPAPTAADFNAGYLLYPSPVTIQVNAVTGSARIDRVATVSVRATSATMGNGKSVADLEWSYGSPVGPWQAMSTLAATVDSKAMQKNRVNDPWSGQIYFRLRLSWATDTPATYTAGLEFLLSVAAQ